jgi:hypothetical protein
LPPSLADGHTRVRDPGVGPDADDADRPVTQRAAAMDAAWIAIAGFVALYFAVRLALRYYFPPDA